MTMWSPVLSEASKQVYRAIAEAIAADVDAGALAPGDRLPTHRELARNLGVAIPTITRAYALAKEWGLISGEVGRGTFVLRRSREGARLLVGRDQDRGLIDLASQDPPPLRGIESRAIAQSLRDISGRADLSSIMRSPSVAGPSRAHAVAARWLARHGIDVPQERLVMAMGPQQALLAIFMACFKPGDIVLCESLTYPGVRALADALRLRLEPVAMDDLGVIPEALERRCRELRPKAIYCVPTVHTVTAALMPEQRRVEIAEIAREHDLLIIEDDEYTFALPRAPRPLSTFAPERSFLVIDTNKCLAPGLRVSQIIAPPDYVEEVVQAVYTSAWMLPPLMLELATDWLDGGLADSLLQQRSVEVDERRLIAQRALGPLEGIDWRSPAGAQHYWLELDAPHRAETVRDHARELGVLVGTASECAVGRTPAPNGLILALGGESDRGRFATGVGLLAEALSRNITRRTV